MTSKRPLYEPALDGLRLIAFISVFFHHLPVSDPGGILRRVHSHGWGGVELFFVISSFVLFRLLDAEYLQSGHISFRKFYIRRILRIYPLMFTFSAAMLLFEGSYLQENALWRFLSVATFTDNIVTAFAGYNFAIPFTTHLWTLAFEFQIYLALPIVFLLWKRHGTRRFLIYLTVIYAACVAARTALTAAGAPHPLVWVTPLLQPDAILIGIVLATGVLDRVNRAVWPPLFFLAMTAFLLTRAPWFGPFRAMSSYAWIAIASLALVQSVRTISALDTFFSQRWIVFLGSISFGLYVFHLVGIEMAQRCLDAVSGSRLSATLGQTSLLSSAAFALTLAFSLASYRWLELPFLRLKDRQFSVVFGRPVDSGGPTKQP